MKQLWLKPCTRAHMSWHGPNFIELLKHKSLLKQKNPGLIKSDYWPRLHSIVMLSKQQLHVNTSHKQCIWHEILASNMCKIGELFSCLSKLKLAPVVYTTLLQSKMKHRRYIDCRVATISNLYSLFYIWTRQFVWSCSHCVLYTTCWDIGRVRIGGYGYGYDCC